MKHHLLLVSGSALAAALAGQSPQPQHKPAPAAPAVEVDAKVGVVEPWVPPPPPPARRPGPTDKAPQPAAAAIDPFAAGGVAVLFDERGDGAVHAAAARYKAHFTPGAATYVPFLGSQAPRNRPVTFTVESASVGGQSLALTARARRRGASRAGRG